MPGDPVPVERRRYPRHVVRLNLRLEAEHAPGGVPVEELTIAEDVGRWGAQVRAASLPVVKGAILQVDEGGDFRTRAEVRNIAIGADGQPRLNLLFLDAPAPERLLPAVGADETPKRWPTAGSEKE
jgi:hypothetical protein